MFYDHFLRTHSWLNWVDEDDDEVGWNEKPENTRYIKILHRNKTRSTGSVDKGKLHPNLLPSLVLWTQTSAGALSRRVPTGV